MLDRLDVLAQTSEMARIYGIEFFDVLNRGSQVLSPLPTFSTLNLYVILSTLTI